jgi:ABC-type Fe3+ transport system permease subunit
MPVGEVLLGGLLAAVASIVVLVLRIRRAPASSSTKSDAPSQARAEPRLALVIDVFAIAAVVCVAIDRCG